MDEIRHPSRNRIAKGICSKTRPGCNNKQSKRKHDRMIVLMCWWFILHLGRYSANSWRINSTSAPILWLESSSESAGLFSRLSITVILKYPLKQSKQPKEHCVQALDTDIIRRIFMTVFIPGTCHWQQVCACGAASIVQAPHLLNHIIQQLSEGTKWINCVFMMECKQTKQTHKPLTCSPAINVYLSGQFRSCENIFGLSTSGICVWLEIPKCGEKRAHGGVTWTTVRAGIYKRLVKIN